MTVSLIFCGVVWTTAKAAEMATTCNSSRPCPRLVCSCDSPRLIYVYTGEPRPSRFGAQAEAVSMIFNAKTGANPESSVGLMSMGGKGPEVLVTLTTDIGKVLDGLHRTRIWGEGHLSTGIQVAGVSEPRCACRFHPPPRGPLPTVETDEPVGKEKMTVEG